MPRKGTRLETESVFSMTWILCLCYSLCAGCVGGEFSQRHNEVAGRSDGYFIITVHSISPPPLARSARETFVSGAASPAAHVVLHGANRILAVKCATISNPAFHFRRAAHP